MERDSLGRRKEARSRVSPGPKVCVQERKPLRKDEGTFAAIN